MDQHILVDLLNARLDDLVSDCVWRTRSLLTPYVETQKLIEACGHDSSELEQAIKAAGEAVAKMDIVRHKVVTKLKADGVCFVVDESKRKELELSRLQ